MKSFKDITENRINESLSDKWKTEKNWRYIHDTEPSFAILYEMLLDIMDKLGEIEEKK